MNLASFVNEYIKTKVDYDHAYGAQCVDLFRQYCKDVLEYPRTESVDGARELYEKYDEFPIEKFHFARYNSGTPVPGDIAVWGKTKENKYGHVAIVLGDKGDALIVFEQNGFTQAGAYVCERSKKNLLGYLAPQV